MKNITKLKFLILGVILSLSIASCKKQEQETVDPEQPPVVQLTEDDLTGISVDVSGAKTKFYLGDEFSAEGIKVYQDYTKYANGELLRDQKECTKYYLDTSNLDISTVGEYQIKVLFRRGVLRYETSYNVTVQSSLLDTSGEKYLAGLEVKYEGAKDLLVGDTFEFDASLLTIKAHYNQSGEEVEEKDFENTDISIDYASVDTSKVGSYMIKYSYSEDLTINGSAYKNVVSSFTIITVANPTKSIKFESGTTKIPASISTIDVSDWKIRVTRERGEEEVVDFNTDLFLLSGVSPFITGRQYAVIRLKENTNKFITVAVDIIESTALDILVGTSLSKYQVLEDANKIQLDKSGKFFVTNNVTIASRGGKDRFSTITFGDRITIKGSDQYVEVVMDNPGTIILYIASSGAEAREITVFSPSGDDLETFITSAEKQEITEVRLEVSEAGTYRVMSPSSVYIHGCIIATEKVEVK